MRSSYALLRLPEAPAAMSWTSSCTSYFADTACILSWQAYYLFTFTCTAFVVPFFNLYFKQLGFSATTIGLFSALRPWVSATSGAARLLQKAL